MRGKRALRSIFFLEEEEEDKRRRRGERRIIKGVEGITEDSCWLVGLCEEEEEVC